MNDNNPCLDFSNALVKARMRDNHKVKLRDSSNDEVLMKLCGEAMQLKKMAKLIRNIIHESNK